MKNIMKQHNIVFVIGCILYILFLLNSNFIKTKTLSYTNISVTANSWTKLVDISSISLDASEILGIVPCVFSGNVTTGYSLALSRNKASIFLLCNSTVTVDTLEICLLYK